MEDSALHYIVMVKLYVRKKQMRDHKWNNKTDHSWIHEICGTT